MQSTPGVETVLSMPQPIPGTEAFPAWMQLVGALVFVVATAVLAAWSTHRGRVKAQEADERAKAEAGAVARHATTMTAMVAAHPQGDALARDALVQTLADIRATLERMNERFDEQERDREADEKAELRELRRLHRSVVGEDPMRKDQR